MALAFAVPAHAWAAPPEEAPPAAEEAAPGLPEGFVPAKVLNEVTVSYPEALAATENPPAGTVEVTYVVGIDGIPKELQVSQSVHPELDAVAVDAVNQLRYEPATYKDDPVEVVLSLRLDLVPPAPEPEPEPEPEPGSTEDPDDPDDIYVDEGDEEDEGGTREIDGGALRVEGVVLIAGDRQPLTEARVLAIPAGDLPPGPIKKRIYDPPGEPEWQASVFTDAEGRFELRGIPNGLARLIVLAPSYERFEYVLEVQEGKVAEVKWYLRPLDTNPFRTTVEVDRDEMVEVTQRSISVEEIGTLPGTQGDALKAIANFPGVARPPFGGGLLVIRGSAPGDSAVYLGYHEIPTLFHFGGLTSVFNSDILSQIDFIPGNFDSRYGDAIGGIVNVQPRAGRRDGYHGYVDSDIFDTGVLVEGPVGKGSFALSGRRSYIDAILPVVIPADAGLNFTLAPRYYDYQGLFDYPVGDGTLSVRAFGSDDRTVLAFPAPNDTEQDDRSSVESTQFFHRVDLVYEARKGPWDFLVTPSYQKNFTSIAAVDTFRLNVDANIFSGRAEIARQLSDWARIRIGTEFVGSFSKVQVEAPTFEGDGEAAFDGGGEVLAPALYATATIAPTKSLSLYPGVRMTAYGGLLDQVTVDPRLRMSYTATETTTITGGVGLYSQSPEPFELSNGFGNPNLSPERSMHVSAGVAQQLPFDLNLEVTGFYKHLWDQVFGSEQLVLRQGQLTPEIFANTGIGRIYGAELLFRKNFTKNLFGWVSYTLSRSERRERPDEPYRLFDFDQTHILTLIASYKLPYNWQIGARFRFVSGNPYTPCTDGVYDASFGGYFCVEAPPNSGRLKPFHQLDLRVDKTWIYRLWRFTLYLDIQNAYNNANAEFQNYSYDFRQNQPITGLPIIPSLGLKAAF